MSEKITALAASTALTADDRAALKAADNWTFHLSPYHGSTIHLHARGGFAGSERIWTVREQLIFPDTRGREYGSTDRMRVIHVDAAAYGYGGTNSSSGGWRWSPGEGIERMPSCFASGPSQDIAHTVAESMRNGDLLTLSWVADNNNQVTENAGLHVDELRLTVAREVKNSSPTQVKKLTYKMITQVSLDNSARMIRREH